jgi:hypothetical protein
MDLTEFGTYASALKCSNCREGLILPEKLELGDSSAIFGTIFVHLS